ncbi:MAG: nicotinate-nucleotide adenylyltransferase [Verrucomicrobiales bacterium]|nr:nicotinate-nucleotide adenylyltransferase [Verrucomicrobiales bacterium]
MPGVEHNATTASQKAFEINMDNARYGTFSEIGAGQEVARWFFRVGGAAGTVAKSISAYDMEVSDAIYGECKRYVSRQRLLQMLEREFSLLQERLGNSRGEQSHFFSFADTVAAKSYRRKNDAHGWLGVRFQHKTGAKASQIIIHTRLLDPENVQQQEALGIIGVNLVYGALYQWKDPAAVIKGLRDDLNRERVEIDMIEFSGAVFKKTDNRLMALQLVQQGHTSAAMFLANGKVVQPAEVLYKKCILVERGSFRPVTNATIDLLESATAMFVQEPQVQDKDIEVLTEMTLNNLTTGNTIDHIDFLQRVDILGALGKNVLISNFGEFHRLAAYLFRYTKNMIGISIGIPTLNEIFNEEYYTNLDGGILESFGRLFKNELRLYVYPWKHPKTDTLVTAGNFRVESHLRHLYAYLAENHYIQGIRGYNEDCLPIFPRKILELISNGESGWEEMVPPKVAEIIKERKLFNYDAE